MMRSPSYVHNPRTPAERRAIRLNKALARAWSKSGGKGPHPGFDFRVYLGRDEVETFMEARARGSVDETQLGLALGKAWLPTARSPRRVPRAV